MAADGDTLVGAAEGEAPKLALILFARRASGMPLMTHDAIGAHAQDELGISETFLQASGRCSEQSCDKRPPAMSITRNSPTQNQRSLPMFTTEVAAPDAAKWNGEPLTALSRPVT